MKAINYKHIVLGLLGLVTMLSSCTETDEIPAIVGDRQHVTFSLSTGSQAQTRATGTLRYVMAVYDASGTNKVVAEQEFGSSTFAVRLAPGTYTCLFWADYGSTNYNATNLMSVALQDAATNAEAFYARQVITVSGGSAVNVTLRRAVAQVILRETANLEVGTLTISCTGYRNFNVGTGVASNEASITKTVTIASAINGSATSPAEVCSIFLLANSDESLLSSFKVQYENEAAKTISNIPIQANCKTNVNGKYGVIYLTFSAESTQKFTMDFEASTLASFTLGAGEYFEYAVGNGNWTQFTSTVSNIPFGGTLGNLRLRGKSSKGTAIDNHQYSKISFDYASVEVSCRGDIRTLVDYEDYETTSTANARFIHLFSNCIALTTAPALPATTLASYCYDNMFSGCTALTTAPALPATTLKTGCYNVMFADCTALTTAPDLPATTLADYCYCNMFSGCSKLSKVKMLATDVSATGCLSYWLTNAGTSATSRTLTLDNSTVYGIINITTNYLPDNWKQGAAGTTINYLN